MDQSQRDQQIAAQFMGGKSIPKIAQEHSLSESTVNRILDALKIDRTQRIKSSSDDKLIDHSHYVVGQRLYNHRQFVQYQDRIEGGKALGWSAKKLAMIEQGHSAITLLELKAIASYLGTTLSQLLEDI